MFRCHIDRAVLAGLLICGVFLSGCGETAQVAELVEQETGKVTEVKLVSAEYCTLQQVGSSNTGCVLGYAMDENVLCDDVENMVLEEVYVESGESVTKGQALAHFSWPEDELLHEKLQLAVDREHYNYEAQQASALLGVNQAKATLAQYPAGSPEAAAAQVQLNKSNFIFNHIDDTALLEAQKELEEYEALSEGRDLCAPFDGIVDSIVPIGQEPVKAGDRFCRIYDRNSVYLGTYMSDSSLFRVGMEVDILRGGQYVCSGTVALAGDVLEVYEGLVVVRPTADADLEELCSSRVSPSISAEGKGVDHVLCIPESAVRTRLGGEYVCLYQDGKLCKRSIQTGLKGTNPVTGEKVREILGGLQEHDQVSVG